MSCYEWERGTIKLPTKIAPKFRKELGDYINQRITRTHAVAVSVSEKVKAQFKGKRKVDFRDELERALFNDCWINEQDFADFFDGRIDDVFFGGDRSRPRPIKPTLKSMGPKCFPSKEILIRCVDFDLYIKDNEVRWNVSENNHACRDAHEHPIAKKLFSLLGQVEWKRGSGGVIEGSDEYRYHEGYGSEVKFRFAYKSPKEKRAELDAATSSSRSTWGGPSSGYYNSLLGVSSSSANLGMRRY